MGYRVSNLEYQNQLYSTKKNNGLQENLSICELTSRGAYKNHFKKTKMSLNNTSCSFTLEIKNKMSIYTFSFFDKTPQPT